MRFLQTIFSKISPAFEQQSRQWYVKCECEKEPDAWGMGGIRCAGEGSPRKMV
tara:strand:- start:131 stop:289 length:159 start_codon:yes stop_codon:yes gene_type:complete